MDNERQLRVRQIYEQAVALPEGERLGFLYRATEGDESLAREVWDLLHAPPQAPPQPPPQPPAVTAPATEAPVETGAQRIGPYRVVRELGRGGMGVVYLALRDDDAFRKRVALKLLLRDVTSEEFIRRFRQERQVLANLDHPHIARILDGGNTTDGMPFYVMDYIEGTPLVRYCDENKLSLPDRVKLFQQICSAVHYLNENLVIHRDLKPGNILVTADGQAKILDFGIAKLQMPITGQEEMTSAQARLMTPGYASPEQISGAPLTKASDIYTLGVILYQLLTGLLPYPDPNTKVAQVMAGVDPPPPSQRVKEDTQRTQETTSQLKRKLTGELDNIVLKALQRDPARRYATARDFSDDLQRFLEERPVLAYKESALGRFGKFARRHTLGVAAAVVILLLLAGGAFQGWQVWKGRQALAQREAEVARLMQTLDKLKTPASAPTGDKEVASMVEDVQRLRASIQALFDDSRPAPAASAGAREKVLERGTQYLSSLQSYAPANPSLARELATTYQAIGEIQEKPRPNRPANRSAALASYQHAAEVLAQTAASHPDDAQLKQMADQLAPRITALGGTAPVAPAETPAVQEPVSVPTPPPPRKAAHASVEPPPVAAAPPTVAAKEGPSAADAAEWRELKDLFASVSSQVESAAAAIQPIQANLARQGQQLNPDTLGNLAKMRNSLANAKAALDAGRNADARDQLIAARAYAERVLKVVGR